MDNNNNQEEIKTDQEVKKPKRDAKGRLLPGECGNPGKVYKRGPNYKIRFRNALEEVSQWKAPDTIIQQIKNAMPKMPADATCELIEAARAHLAAMMGESWAFDRLYDRPGQSVDLTSKNEKISSPIFLTSDPELKEMISKLSTGE